MNKKLDLLQDESIYSQYKPHWFIFLPNILTMFSILCIILLYNTIIDKFFLLSMFPIQIFYFFFIVSILHTIKNVIKYKFNYYIITNQRLIIKEGLFFINFKEILFNKIESVESFQNLIEKQFNVGTIIIKGTGNSETIIFDLDNHLTFKNTLLENIKKI